MRPTYSPRQAGAASGLRTSLVVFTRTHFRWQQRGRSLDQALEELPTTFSAAARVRAHLHLALAARVLAPGRPARAPSGRRAGLPLPSGWSPDVPPSRATRTVVSGLTSRRRPR